MDFWKSGGTSVLNLLAKLSSIDEGIRRRLADTSKRRAILRLPTICYRYSLYGIFNHLILANDRHLYEMIYK